jgi:hypothetical protein
MVGWNKRNDDVSPVSDTNDGEEISSHVKLRENIADVLSSSPRALKASSSATLPLSLHLMQSVSGLCCIQCATTSEQEKNPEKKTWQSYDLDALAKQKSAASPLVLAPMSSPITDSTSTQALLAEYMSACRFYGCGDRINAGILTTIRFQLPSMRVSADFHDADMLALSEVLLRHANGALQFIRRLDFGLSAKEGKLHGKTGFRSHGALALAKVLQMSQHIQEVSLLRNQIGHYGASAIFIACCDNSSIRKLVIRRCSIGERGAMVFAELIATSSECGLVDLDLSANHIGFKGTLAIEDALRQRNARNLLSMTVDLEGNLIFQEVMNGVTHGLGMLLAIIGARLMSLRTHGLPQRYVVSCGVYSASVMVLFTSSTLYHSFFTLRATKWLFEVMDKCAIYILISGSYTPFLQIIMTDEPMYSVYLLSFLWVCSFLGIAVEAFCPTWKYRSTFSLAMYLSMGWSTL